MKTTLILGATLTVLAAAPAFAQSTDQQTTVVTKKHESGTAGGAATGAIAGAVVGGPVGAAVGAVAGAAVGHAVAPPTEVKTYVTTHDVPAVKYGHPIAVGHTVNGDVAWREVPSYPKYRWAYIDGHRVVIDNQTRDVVAVY